MALGWVERVLVYLDSALELHIAKEEGPLFPCLKAALLDNDRLVDEMVAEHDLIRIKREAFRSTILGVLDGDHHEVQRDLQSLRAIVPPTSRGAGYTSWLNPAAAAVQVLVQKLTVHFVNEEQLVFPLTTQLLNARTLARIDAAMRALDTTGGGRDDDGA